MPAARAMEGVCWPRFLDSTALVTWAFVPAFNVLSTKGRDMLNDAEFAQLEFVTITEQSDVQEPKTADGRFRMEH